MGEKKREADQRPITFDTVMRISVTALRDLHRICIISVASSALVIFRTTMTSSSVPCSLRHRKVKIKPRKNCDLRDCAAPGIANETSPTFYLRSIVAIFFFEKSFRSSRFLVVAVASRDIGVEFKFERVLRAKAKSSRV